MNRRSRRTAESTDDGARAARPPILVLVALVLCAPGSVRAQPETDSTLAGSWVVRRSGDDELVLRLEVDGDSCRFTVIRPLNHWPVVPDASRLTPGDSDVVEIALDDRGSARLSRGDWWARLELQSPSTAIVVAADPSRIGIAHRLIPIAEELLGEWTRAELSPAGPRVRRLVVEADRVVFYDQLDRAETVRASGVQTTEPGAAVALFPDDRSGALVRLIPFDGGYLALEAGDDELQVIYPPGAPPRWLPLEPDETAPETARSHSLTGRWLVATGDRDRQTALLDFTASPASITQLGRNRTDSLRVVADSAPPYFRLAVGPGTEGAAEYRHVLLIDDAFGVMWRDDDNQYQTLRRVIDPPEGLTGEWRVENVGAWAEDRVSLTGSGLYRPRDHEVVPVLFTRPRSASLDFVLAAEGRIGRLLRLWSVGEGAFVTDMGAFWYRPGGRAELSTRFTDPSCAELCASISAQLADCLVPACSEENSAGCPQAAELLEPLRCTEDHLRQAERIREEPCEDAWDRAFGDSPF